MINLISILKTKIKFGKLIWQWKQAPQYKKSLSLDITKRVLLFDYIRKYYCGPDGYDRPNQGTKFSKEQKLVYKRV